MHLSPWVRHLYTYQSLSSSFPSWHGEDQEQCSRSGAGPPNMVIFLTCPLLRQQARMPSLDFDSASLSRSDLAQTLNEDMKTCLMLLSAMVPKMAKFERKVGVSWTRSVSDVSKPFPYPFGRYGNSLVIQLTSNVCGTEKETG